MTTIHRQEPPKPFRVPVVVVILAPYAAGVLLCLMKFFF
jgi:hypothetical protein